MRTFFTLLGREMRGYFYSPIAYVVLFFVFALNGVAFSESMGALNKEPQTVGVLLRSFGSLVFWFSLALIYPITTMRCFSEEFRSGTIETLTTAPVKDWQIVGAKFFGAWFFSMLFWAPLFCYVGSFEKLTGQDPAHSVGAFWAAFGMLGLVSMFYTAIGCLGSVLCREQINAAAISFSTTVLFLFSGIIPNYFTIPETSAAVNLISYINTPDHIIRSALGVVDTRPIVYYVSMTSLFLFVTYHVFQYRKWKA